MKTLKITLSILLLLGSLASSKLVYANPCLSSDGTYIEFIKYSDMQPIRLYLKKECVYGKLNSHLLVFNVTLADESSESSASEQVFEGHLMVLHNAPRMDMDSKIKDMKEISSLVGTRSVYDVYADNTNEDQFSLVSQDERNPVLFICSGSFCDYIKGHNETIVKFRGRFSDGFEPLHVDSVLSLFIARVFND